MLILKEMSLGAAGACVCVSYTTGEFHVGVCAHVNEGLHDTKSGYAQWSSGFMSSYLLLIIKNRSTDSVYRNANIYMVIFIHRQKRSQPCRIKSDNKVIQAFAVL